MAASGYQEMKDFSALYSQKGAYHHQASGFKAWFLDDNYRAIAAECPARATILDLACGEGCLGPYLPRPLWLIGVDHSTEALELNHRLYPGLYDELLLGDLRRLELLGLQPASFDVIVCSLSLMYLLPEDLPGCLSQIHSLLASGGLFILTYPTLGPHRAASAEAAELKPLELKESLGQAGFSIEKMVPICPFLPRRLVEASQRPEGQEEALAAYQQAKAAMQLEESYHFLIRARRRK